MDETFCNTDITIYAQSVVSLGASLYSEPEGKSYMQKRICMQNFIKIYHAVKEILAFSLIDLYNLD